MESISLSTRIDFDTAMPWHLSQFQQLAGVQMKRLDNGQRIDFSGGAANVSAEQRAKVEEILKECGCSGQWIAASHSPVAFGSDDRESSEVSEWLLQVNQEDVAKVQAALDKVS